MVGVRKKINFYSETMEERYKLTEIYLFREDLIVLTHTNKCI